MAIKKQIVESTAFKAQKPNYVIWEDFCAGGAQVEGKKAYLPQHPFESDTQYKIRQALATYKNHAKPIVSVFTSAIWRKKPNRDTLPEDLKAYDTNVDLFGTGADMFFRNVNQKAAEVGIWFILVDSNKAPDGVEVKTKKDSKDFNIRPFFVAIPALSVVAWGFDDDGLNFLVIEENSEKVIDPFSDPVKERFFKVWYRDRWDRYKETDKEGLVLESSGSHPCQEIPVVPCYFKKKAELIGESATSDVTSLLKRIYIMGNTLDKSLFDTAFPQQYFFGFEKEEIESYIKASSNGLVSSNHEASSDFIEPQGRAFEALEKQIRADEQAIKEIALRMIRPDSKVGESAEAKKIDNQQLNSQLSVFSQNCQDAENKCWELMSKWIGGKSETIAVEYHKDFDIETITGDLLRAFVELRRDKNISKETLLKILQKAEIPFPDDFDIEAEIEKIDDELRSAGTMGNLGSSFLTGTGK